MDKYFCWFGLPGGVVLSSLLSMLAVGMAAGFRTRDRILCAAAMLLSTVGDAFMAHYWDISHILPIPPFFMGAAFFILAHIVYIFAFTDLIRQRAYAIVNPGFWIAVSIVLACGIFVVYRSLAGGHTDPVMLVLCLVYMCIIGANCACIFSFAWSVKSIRSLAALGALSFFLSDLIIGFNALVTYPGDRIWGWIWWLYPIGQFFIILCA